MRSKREKKITAKKNLTLPGIEPTTWSLTNRLYSTTEPQSLAWIYSIKTKSYV